MSDQTPEPERPLGPADKPVVPKLSGYDFYKETLGSPKHGLLLHTSSLAVLTAVSSSRRPHGRPERVSMESIESSARGRFGLYAYDQWSGFLETL